MEQGFALIYFKTFLQTYSLHLNPDSITSYPRGSEHAVCVDLGYIFKMEECISSLFPSGPFLTFPGAMTISGVLETPMYQASD